MQQGIAAAWEGFKTWFGKKIDSLLPDIPDALRWLFKTGGASAPLAVGGYDEAMSLDMAPAARSVTESRSETVSRQENTVILVPPEGWGTEVRGPSAGVAESGRSLQIGAEAYVW